MSCPKIAFQARFVKTIIEIIILLSMVQVFSLYFLSPQEIGSNIVQLSRLSKRARSGGLFLLNPAFFSDPTSYTITCYKLVQKCAHLFF